MTARIEPVLTEIDLERPDPVAERLQSLLDERPPGTTRRAWIERHGLNEREIDGALEARKNGRRVDTIEKIAAAFHVRAAWLAFGDGARRAHAHEWLDDAAFAHLLFERVVVELHATTGVPVDWLVDRSEFLRDEFADDFVPQWVHERPSIIPAHGAEGMFAALLEQFRAAALAAWHDDLRDIADARRLGAELRAQLEAHSEIPE